MATRETIESYLMEKIEIGEDFPKFFTAFIFAGGAIPRNELLEHLKYLFEIAKMQLADDLALNVLKKIQIAYHMIEEEAERKKEWQHFGEASKRADDKFFAFIANTYHVIPTSHGISYFHDLGELKETESIMKKTRFHVLEFASQQWTQEMTEESYVAFRFLVDTLNPLEKKEILDKILSPRVENWFKNVELIEKWIMTCKRDPVPHEVQQLLAMARAKNGGPELAKKDIANSRMLEPEIPLGGQRT